jgi:hypothetical protein
MVFGHQNPGCGLDPESGYVLFKPGKCLFIFDWMLNLVTGQKQQQKMSLPTVRAEATNGTYFLTENGNSTLKFTSIGLVY